MPGNILLVDDAPDFREEFKDYFRGYRAIGVSRGKEALAELEKH